LKPATLGSYVTRRTRAFLAQQKRWFYRAVMINNLLIGKLLGAQKQIPIIDYLPNKGDLQ
jgi:hypothetical protein